MDAERQQYPPHPLGYVWQLAALWVPPGSLPWLHELRHPTLVVAGDDDPILPEANALMLARRIPRARLLLAPGEGHLMLLDPDSAAYPVIRSFLVSDDLPSSDARRSTFKPEKATVERALRAGGVPFPHLVWALNTLTRAVYADDGAPAADDW